MSRFGGQLRRPKFCILRKMSMTLYRLELSTATSRVPTVKRFERLLALASSLPGAAGPNTGRRRRHEQQ